MFVSILKEAGYDEAAYGLGLSYGLTTGIPFGDFKSSLDPEILSITHRIHSRICALAGKGNGHDKFLRQVKLWVLIKAPLFLWKEFDQYKVGTTTQSESTMHTIMKRPVVPEDFEGFIPSTTMFRLNDLIERGDFQAVINELPSGYLQGRVVTMNYENLRNIMEQRKGHKLPQWGYLIDSMQKQCMYPHLLETAE